MSTGSEAVEGSAGRLAATEAVVTRVRMALEASRSYVFGRGIAPQPSLEAGLRRDGGDAKMGAGADTSPLLGALGRGAAHEIGKGLSLKACPTSSRGVVLPQTSVTARNSGSPNPCTRGQVPSRD